MVVHSETDNGYFESLDWQGKRYKEKLETVGLSLQDDPYCLDERFSSDMTSWPKIEYGHIFAYFITRPSTYTQQELVSNYFGSGYVRTVLFAIWKREGEMCSCESPSQRSPDNAHGAWLITKMEGGILCAHCEIQLWHGFHDYTSRLPCSSCWVYQVLGLVMK